MSSEGKQASQNLYPLPVRTADKRCDRESEAGEERQGISKRNKTPWASVGRP
jgi:hypothetical protein